MLKMFRTKAFVSSMLFMCVGAIALSGSELASAAMSRTVSVTGTVDKVSEKTFVLKSRNGSVKLPRSALKSQDQLKPNAQITVKLPLAAVIYYNR